MRTRGSVIVGVLVAGLAILLVGRGSRERSNAPGWLDEHPPNQLTGLLFNARGGPIAGATIVFGGAHAITTDESGAFAIDLPPGLHVLDVSATGYATSREHAVAPGRIEISLYPEAVIEGRIVRGSTDAPVEGAQLVMNGTSLRFGLTDALGSFRFDSLRPGQYNITARAAGWAATSDEAIDVDSGETRRILVRAQPAFTVSAEVIVEATGARCDKPYLVLRSAIALAEGRGDSQGRVSVDGLLPGRYAVRVHCPGWGSTELPAIRIESSSLLGLSWTVPKGHRILGLAQNGSGAPVVGVRVTARLLGAGELLGTSTVTDQTGHFELRGVVGGSQQVMALLGASFTSTVIHVGSSDVDGIVLRPKPSTTVEALLEGLVVTEEDRPVAGLVLALEPVTSLGEDAASQRVVTDRDGRFSARVRARLIELSMPEPRGLAFVGRSREFHPFRLRPGALTRARFVVSRADQSIRGRVVDAARKPIEGATVVAMPEGEGEVFGGISEGWVRPMAQALSDENGSFELDGLTHETYRVRAIRARRGQAVARVVRAPSTIELVVETPGAISGRFSSADGRQPRFVVVAKQRFDEFSRRGEFSAPGGEFTLRDLPPGRYVLSARGEGAGGSAEVDLHAGQHLRDVEIRLRRSYSLTGRVLAPDGRAISDCYLLLEGETEMVRAETNVDGKFTFPEAGPGPRSLFVSCAGVEGEAHCSDHVSLVLPSDRPLVLDPIVLPVQLGPGMGIEESLGVDLEGGEVKLVREPSAAARAGLRVGDSITAVDGFDVRGRPLVLECLLDAGSGETRSLALARGASVSIVIP